jgi:peptidoglycan/LPS O-acetylase OafA/YrhL
MFYVRRTLRIFPLYYATLFGSVALSLIILRFNDRLGPSNFLILRHWVWLALYASNFAMVRDKNWTCGLLNVSWSLAIEEQFYLIWPWIIRFTSLCGLRRVCIGMIVLAAMLRTGMCLLGFSGIQIYMLTLCRMDALAAGGLVAIAARSELTSAAYFARLGLFGSIAVLVACVKCGWLASQNPLIFGAIGYPAVIVAGAAGMFLLLEFRPTPTIGHRIFESRLMCFFGKYSYAIYLFHEIIRYAVVVFFVPRVLRMWPTWIVCVVYYLVVTALTLGAALISWSFFERPILDMRNRLV